MDGKVCVITGAAKGIGRATALEMARRGGKVVVSDIDLAGAEDTAQAIASEGGASEAVRCDVAVKEDVEGLVSVAVSAFGGIDVLHNNAGIQETSLTDAVTVQTLPDEVWEKVYQVNLRGMWWCIKAAAPALLKSTRGPAIINSASVVSLVGYPNNPIYGPTKAAIVALTKQTAIDLSPVVRCNCYAPAAINTGMLAGVLDSVKDREAFERGVTATHLVPRIGEPQDVADLVCFLASDKSSFITGSLIPIDGGSLAWRGSNA